MIGEHMSQLATRQVNPSPQAYSFFPSQNWDGNDGAWTTFVIRVGTPSQYFRVLPTLSDPYTYLPLPLKCSQGVSNCGNARGVEPFKSPSTAISTKLSTLDAGLTCSTNRSPLCETCVSIEGKCTTGPCAGQYCCGNASGACNSASCNGVSGICTQAYIGCPCTGDDYDVGKTPKDPGAANPAASTGFLGYLSSTWSSISHTTLTNDEDLSVSGNGTYGLEMVGLGPTPDAGLSINQKTLVAGADVDSLFLGSLGLQPSNSSRFEESSSSLLTNLKNDGLIPSLSYGYTAGAIYKEQGVQGSLTLGGYDSSRFVPNEMTFPIPISEDNPRLEAKLQSIGASGTLAGDVTLLSSNVSIYVDSTSPYLYLPKAACPKFERAFGLKMNANLNLYQLNATTHGKLRTANPILNFTFASPGAEPLQITVPYQAFDLQTTAPITPNGTNYFPLRCTDDASQFVLGRALLQETYIIADYESGNFSISQADFSGKPANIITINHASSTTGETPVATSSNTSSNSSSSNSGLRKGAIAGIAIGASIFIILLLALVFFFIRRRRRHATATRNSVPISDPIPYSKAAGSWSSSPSSSQNPTSTTNPTNPAMAIAPISQIEERLQRLERANTAARGPDNELPNTNGWAEERNMLPPYEQRPTQELPGSAAAAEIAQRSNRGSRDGVGEGWEGRARRGGGARHIAELASESWVSKGMGS